MFPVVEFGPIAVRSYSLGFALGAGLAILILCLGARAEGVKPVRLFELGLLSVCIGILGARALDVVVHRDYYADHPLEVFALWKGAAFLGGPLVIIPFVAVYAPLVGLPLWRTYDLMALGLCAA